MKKQILFLFSAVALSFSVPAFADQEKNKLSDFKGPAFEQMRDKKAAMMRERGEAMIKAADCIKAASNPEAARECEKRAKEERHEFKRKHMEEMKSFHDKRAQCRESGDKEKSCDFRKREGGMKEKGGKYSF